MELTIKEEKALKQFIRATQNDIRIDFEGEGKVGCKFYVKKEVAK